MTQMKSVALYTLGCRVNQYETEAITEGFLRAGYTVVDFEAFSDVYLVNTCSVTSISDKKSRKMLRKVKRINPNAIVVAVGCYVQVAPEEVAAIDGVDIVVGSSDKGNIPYLVEKFKEDRTQIIKVDNIMNPRKFEELQIDDYQDKKRAFLKIQDGCDRFCSYCMIPYARGPVRSRDPINIITEVNKLAKNGFKEIILSGIHVASYGKDLGGVSLTDIIERINTIDGIERIRIGSVEPMFFTFDIVKRLSVLDKFCPHFHLSLQSGCNATLKRMNRRYTTEEYSATVRLIRESFSDPSITTDIIVGFPGETEQEFKETFNFLKELQLSKMHIFKYSPRKGTKASELVDQVTPEIKEERSNKLLQLDSQNEKAFALKYLKKTVRVLFENKSGDRYFGYTKNYLQVELKSPLNLAGKLLNVKLTEVIDNHVKGILVFNNFIKD